MHVKFTESTFSLTDEKLGGAVPAERDRLDRQQISQACGFAAGLTSLLLCANLFKD